MKIVHGIIALIFVWFAYVQINDPDPIGWVLIYFGVTVSIIMYLLEKNVHIVPLSGAIVCVIGMLLLIPDFLDWVQMGAPTITGSMKAESPHVEYTREFFGFIIAGITYFVYFKLMLKSKCDC